MRQGKFQVNARRHEGSIYPGCKQVLTPKIDTALGLKQDEKDSQVLGGKMGESMLTPDFSKYYDICRCRAASIRVKSQAVCRKTSAPGTRRQGSHAKLQRAYGWWSERSTADGAVYTCVKKSTCSAHATRIIYVREKGNPACAYIRINNQIAYRVILFKTSLAD